ncbi:chaperone protein dnaJ 11, chloroplastic [Quercus suber]|uniref:Chaperone protein dnaj 11 n=1 Tax=Quercus suber TaxID=58331 RepID=A0AAW0LHT7_QUESU|nr:chaperone protein dnaJ 11, chloroplastic-like [Quercus suber]POE93757.1 chaperone protein dnaj 11, chloroplastic [Quercus suber]
MLGNSTLVTPKSSLGFKISHPNNENDEGIWPRKSCIRFRRTQFKTIITLSDATATESTVDGSERTMKSSSSLLSAITRTATTTTTTLYKLLRVKQTASQAEIKAAYRGLAKQYHPDAMSSSNPNGPDFIEIHKAYATLSNPIARARYDLSIGVTTTTAARRGYRYTAAGFPTPTRRWETDQCW